MIPFTQVNHRLYTIPYRFLPFPIEVSAAGHLPSVAGHFPVFFPSPFLLDWKATAMTRTEAEAWAMATDRFGAHCMARLETETWAAAAAAASTEP